MKYFAVFLPMRDEAKSKKYRPDHLQYLEAMREEDRIFIYGPLTDGAGGLIIYQAENISDVREWAENDPYVRLGARGLEIHEWAMQTDYTFNK